MLSLGILSYGQIITLHFGQNKSKIEGVNGTEIKGFTEPFVGRNIFIGVEYLNKNFFNMSTNFGYLNKKGSSSYWISSPYGGSSDIFNKVELSYLSSCTNFDLKYPILDSVYPFVSIGPRLDYLVKNNNDATMEILTPFAFGITVGGGVKIIISKIQIGLRVDYNMNFNKHASLPIMAGYTGFSIAEQMVEKTSLIRFSVGYSLK